MLNCSADEWVKGQAGRIRESSVAKKFTTIPLIIMKSHNLKLFSEHTQFNKMESQSDPLIFSHSIAVDRAALRGAG